MKIIGYFPKYLKHEKCLSLAVEAAKDCKIAKGYLSLALCWLNHKNMALFKSLNVEISIVLYDTFLLDYMKLQQV